MENEIHVANFAFIITAFAKADILELEGFLMRTRRILLLQSNSVTWRDITMILSVAERLKLAQSEWSQSEVCESYWEVLLECIDHLLETSSKKMTYETATLIIITISSHFPKRSTNESVWAKLDLVLIQNEHFHRDLIRNNGGLFKIILIYIKHYRDMSREAKLASSTESFG